LKMTSSELIPAAVLKRKAVVYVRQSTQSQVMTNLESQRRQYDLVDLARQRGFVDVEIIDDDLGRSASGTVARPGFDRLVAWLCAGKVGAVLCLDASRLARATVGIGITCSNCAGLSTPASSISMAFTIPAGPMIACSWA
jgi:DNA invertase Pin-like site-specific DNA recombinase